MQQYELHLFLLPSNLFFLGSCIVKRHIKLQICYFLLELEERVRLVHGVNYGLFYSLHNKCNHKD